MPRKDKASYKQYMREYMKAKRQGLTGINTRLVVGVRGFEPPTSASQTLRAKPTALHPVVKQYNNSSGYQSKKAGDSFRCRFQGNEWRDGGV